MTSRYFNGYPRGNYPTSCGSGIEAVSLGSDNTTKTANVTLAAVLQHSLGVEQV